MMTVKLAGMEALNTKSLSYDQFPEGPGTRASSDCRPADDLHSAGPDR